MRLLIVVPSQERATGNWVTASRLQQGLVDRGQTVTIAATTGDPAELRASVAGATPELALLLHAWRSGRPWLESGLALPYAVLLTGTDINAGIHDPTQAPVIAAVLAGAAAILLQDPASVARLRRDCPTQAQRIHYLPPGIILGAEPCPLRARLALAAGELLCLCPAGIRPVKGVVELLAMCDPLRREGRPLRLACCGPLLDGTYSRKFLAAVAARPWAEYLGVVPAPAMPAALRQADVILSNSFSEGLPNALAEAAALGRPIVASAIPGHLAVVADGVNGLLYADAAGFQRVMRRLLDEPGLLAALSHPAPQRFAPEREAATLEAICRGILAERQPTCVPQM